MTDIDAKIAATTEPVIIRWLRRDLGMTQEEAGLVFGVSRRQWCRYENGVSKFPKRRWVDIMRLFVALRGDIMPYRRQGKRVEKYEGGRWKLVKEHPSKVKAAKHLTALRINVESKEKS